MTFDLITGLQTPDLVSFALRGTLGLFFAISGFHKLFNATRRASVEATFRADGCYSPPMMFIVPGGEFLGGLALLAGFLTPIACAGLIVICAGACLLDGLKRIKTWLPLDRADYVDDLLYLPEVLYIIMLVLLIVLGPGRFSLDAYIWNTLFR